MYSSHTPLRLDPRFPMVWEDPTTLRVGFDRPIARLTASSPATQAVVAALCVGATPADLAAVNAAAAETVLRVLAPALTEVPATASHRMPEAPPLRAAPRAPVAPAARPPVPRSRAHESPQPRGQSPIRVRFNDDGRTVPALVTALELGLPLEFIRGGRLPDLAIEVLRFLEPLGRTRRWLSVGVPHLLIRFTDTAARVGPLISGDGAPCHGCETLHLTEHDPALPLLASQLYGGVPASETRPMALLVSAYAAAYIDSWRDGETWVHHHQASLPTRSAHDPLQPRWAPVAVHPQCGCAISGEPPPPRQTERAVATPERRSQTQRGEARRGRG